jgi:MFS family permease
VFKTLVSAYQVGCMVGSLIFGVFAFIVGRKKIFLVDLI